MPATITILPAPAQPRYGRLFYDPAMRATTVRPDKAARPVVRW